MGLRVAIVSADPEVRLAAARALDAAPTEWSIELADEAPAGVDVVVSGPDVDPPVGIVFDPEKGGDLIARVTEQRARSRPVVVIGASGGCGATTVALHLARAFARSASTCLIESSTRAGAAERLGLDRSSLKKWSDGGVPPEGLRLTALPMEGGWRAAFAQHQGASSDEVVGLAAREFERVVIDAGPAATPALNEAVRVVVVAATLPGALRARLLLEEAPSVVVLNRTGVGGECGRGRLEAALGMRASLALPHRPSLRAAEDAGRLLRPGSPWDRKLDRLARSIARVA